MWGEKVPQICNLGTSKNQSIYFKTWSPDEKVTTWTSRNQSKKNLILLSKSLLRFIGHPAKPKWFRFSTEFMYSIINGVMCEFAPMFGRNLLPPFSGWLNFVQVVANQATKTELHSHLEGGGTSSSKTYKKKPNTRPKNNIKLLFEQSAPSKPQKLLKSINTKVNNETSQRRKGTSRLTKAGQPWYSITPPATWYHSLA